MDELEIWKRKPMDLTKSQDTISESDLVKLGMSKKTARLILDWLIERLGWQPFAHKTGK